MNGVTGATRITSETAFGARSGSRASSSHCSGWPANSRSAWASCDWVVSTPPTSTLRTRLRSSASSRRSSPSRAAIRVESRSSPGSARLRGDQHVEVGVELLAGALDLLAVLGERRPVELELDPPRPVGEPLGVGDRRADHGRDRHRRVRLGQRADRVALARRRDPANSPAMNSRITRAPAVGGARGERRVDQVAQPAVVVAVDVEDVARDLLAERPLLHLEHLGERLAREGRLLRAQEELARLALEHHGAEAGAGEPALGGQLLHPAVELGPAQVGVELVEARAARGRRGAVGHRLRKPSPPPAPARRWRRRSAAGSRRP